MGRPEVDERNHMMSMSPVELWEQQAFSFVQWKLHITSHRGSAKISSQGKLKTQSTSFPDVPAASVKHDVHVPSAAHTNKYAHTAVVTCLSVHSQTYVPLTDFIFGFLSGRLIWPLKPKSECTCGGGSTFLVHWRNNKPCWVFLAEHRLDQSQSLMVWSAWELQLFGFYHLDYVEARSPENSPAEAKQSRVLQGKSKSNTHRFWAPGSRERKWPGPLEVIKPLI